MYAVKLLEAGPKFTKIGEAKTVNAGKAVIIDYIGAKAPKVVEFYEDYDAPNDSMDLMATLAGSMMMWQFAIEPNKEA